MLGAGGAASWEGAATSGAGAAVATGSEAERSDPGSAGGATMPGGGRAATSCASVFISGGRAQARCVLSRRVAVGAVVCGRPGSAGGADAGAGGWWSRSEGSDATRTCTFRRGCGFDGGSGPAGPGSALRVWGSAGSLGVRSSREESAVEASRSTLGLRGADPAGSWRCWAPVDTPHRVSRSQMPVVCHRWKMSCAGCSQTHDGTRVYVFGDCREEHHNQQRPC